MRNSRKRRLMIHAAAALMLVLCCLSGAAYADERGDMVLAVAVNELGYTATKGGYSKYGDWAGNAYGQWCSEFISWCVNRADEVYGVNLYDDAYPMRTSCEGSSTWYQEHGRYISVSGSLQNAGEQFYLSDGVSVTERPYVPQAGDLIYFEWYQYNRLDHVGIVEYVTQEADGGYIVHTIEGNNVMLGPEPSVVARYSYRLDDPSIRGYGILRENYVGVELTMGSSGGAVVEFQTALRDLGYYNGDCEGKFGKATQEATKKFQKAMGLTQTGSADRATQQALNALLAAKREEAEARAQEEAAAEAAQKLEAAKQAVSSSWFGEFDPHDEASVWERLIAPITVLDAKSNEKVYLYDAPNGQRSTASHRGFVYGSSVAVHVIEEQGDWTKIETYNDYDELEQGWIRSNMLKTATPDQTYGLVVDKMTQRLYLYKEGKYVTELLVSTGTVSGGNEGYNETASGEFLLCSRTGGFWAGNLWCDKAIRFNGGDLLHLVPSIQSKDGTMSYASCESALGTRASHGCIRVQRVENADGYNHDWLWENVSKQGDVKLIVWDDDGRRLQEIDPSTPVYYNPVGGEKFHTDPLCSSVRSAYLPLTEITYGDLTRSPFTALRPCGTCDAPERPETIEAWNAVIDQAYMQLGMTP